MGTLRIMHYRSPITLKLADHTYVICGTGARAWGCFGGKTGGTEARHGDGSTHRADVIAEPNEHGGLKCYLINGVCHQAANRIAMPANILCTRATVRGYGLSESIYGPYGRPGGILGLCRSPFHQHPEITDDLPACAPVPRPRNLIEQPPKKKKKKGKIKIQFSDRETERKYINGTLKIYDDAGSLFFADKTPNKDQVRNFQLALFMHKVKYDLGSDLTKPIQKTLGQIRLDFEDVRMVLDEAFVNKEMPLGEFAKLFDIITVWFQNAMANAIKTAHYNTILGTKPDDTLTLSDPEIIKKF